MSARGGIDLGGTKIQAVVVDGRAGVLGKSRRATPTTGGPPAVVAEMAIAIEQAASDAELAASELLGVGVGAPGEIDRRRGTVSHARNLPEWMGTYPLARELKKAVAAPVVLGNDVEVATDAEARLGAGTPYSSLLAVFWGTGIGGGLVLGGKPWLGRGSSGEIGHMVVKQNGARCTCGRRGCLEAYAGREAMELRARRKLDKGKKTSLFKIMEQCGRDRLTAKVWERALDDGDKLAGKLIDRAVAALGTGIASAVNLLDVEAVLIGGGLGVRLGPRYLTQIKDAMMPHLFADDRPPIVEIAGLGDLGGAIGASMLIPTRRRTTAGRAARVRPSA